MLRGVQHENRNTASAYSFSGMKIAFLTGRCAFFDVHFLHISLLSKWRIGKKSTSSNTAEELRYVNNNLRLCQRQ